MAKSTKKKDATIATGKAHPTPEALPQRKPSCSKKSTLACEEPHPHPSDEQTQAKPSEEKALQPQAQRDEKSSLAVAN